MRILAISRLTDFSKLKKVISDDIDDRARLAAVRVLADSLTKINPTDRVKINNLLADTAINHRCQHTRRAAIFNINDQELLTKIALSNSDFGDREAAIRGIKAQETLVKIAQNGREYFPVRRAAILQLDSQQVLETHALKDKDYSIREVAITKVVSIPIIEKVALKDSNHFVRKAATSKLTSQEVLIKIALTDSNDSVREEATSRITSQDTLLKIVQEDKSADVRVAAVLKIENQDVIRNLTNSGNPLRVREAAISCINDIHTRDKPKSRNLPISGLDYLIELYKSNWREYSIELAVIKRIIEGEFPVEESFLIEAALKDQELDIICLVLHHIRDEEGTLKIVRKVLGSHCEKIDKYETISELLSNKFMPIGYENILAINDKIRSIEYSRRHLRKTTSWG